MERAAEDYDLRVLHVIPSIAPRYGGPSRAALEMSRALLAQGVEVLLATTDADGEGRLPVHLETEQAYQGVPAIFFSRQWSEAYKYSRPLSSWLYKNVSRFDLVHIHAVFSHACLAASKACRRHGVPYIVRPLGSLDPWSMKQKPLRKRIFWYAGVRRMLSSAAAIHYTALPEQRLAEETLGLGRGVTIPLGIDLNILSDATRLNDFRELFPALGDSPYVLALSRLHPKKGLYLLLKSFLSLIQEKDLKHWKLIIAGDGEPNYKSDLKRMVKENDAERSVIFTGWLEGEVKLAALRGAQLLALPSFQENFGLCVMEALACGVPVLISPHVNLAEEIETACAGWVASLDDDSLTGALSEALRQADERSRRGLAGKHLARRYNWEAIASEMIQLYRATILPVPVNETFPLVAPQ